MSADTAEIFCVSHHVKYSQKYSFGICDCTWIEA